MNHSDQVSTGSLHKNSHEELEAFGEWVVVTRKKAPEKTEAGVFLPETARAKMEAEYVGTVVSIGDDAAIKYPKLKLGDRIVYRHVFPMNKTDSPDEIYSLVHIGNILAWARSKTITPAMAPGVDKFRQD
jgi:co-chaperonin GroES (HSP10)